MNVSSKEVANIATDNVVVRRSCKLQMGGNPESQTRPRLGRGGFHDSRSKGMAAFKARIRDGIPNSPLLWSNQPVSVCIKLCMRRPNTHFKKNSRLEALKATVPFAHVAHPDTDSILKFVPDGTKNWFATTTGKSSSWLSAKDHDQGHRV